MFGAWLDGGVVGWGCLRAEGGKGKDNISLILLRIRFGCSK